MRIALVCDWFLPRIGGIERHLDQLSAELAAYHDVTVITPTKGPPFTASGIRVHRLPAFLLPGAKLLWTPLGFRRLRDAIQSGGFDIVHIHSSIVSPTAFAALRFAHQAGLPTVVTGHSILAGFLPIFRRWDQWSHWSRWPVAFSGVSERVAGELRSFISPQPVDVLPNAIHPHEWRLARHAPDDCINIAAVMRLAPRKRGAALLRAFARARQQLPSTARVQLNIAGDGTERSRLERLAGELEIHDAVTFHGSLRPEEVKALLSRSHFFVLPSELEAFGIAALEARAAGLPVIAMQEGGVKEFIEHGKNGLLARNDEELARYIQCLCADRSLRETIADFNRGTSVQFDWNHTLAAHFATYERARHLSTRDETVTRGWNESRASATADTAVR